MVSETVMTKERLLEAFAKYDVDGKAEERVRAAAEATLDAGGKMSKGCFNCIAKEAYGEGELDLCYYDDDVENFIQEGLETLEIEPWTVKDLLNAAEAGSGSKQLYPVDAGCCLLAHAWKRNGTVVNVTSWDVRFRTGEEFRLETHDFGDVVCWFDAFGDLSYKNNMTAAEVILGLLDGKIESHTHAEEKEEEEVN